MALFFHMHSRFDWSRYCWCIEGARRLDTLHSNSSDDALNHGECCSAEAFGGLAGYPAPLLLSQVSERPAYRPTPRGYYYYYCWA